MTKICICLFPFCMFCLIYCVFLSRSTQQNSTLEHSIALIPRKCSQDLTEVLVLFVTGNGQGSETLQPCTGLFQLSPEDFHISVGFAQTFRHITASIREHTHTHKSLGPVSSGTFVLLCAPAQLQQTHRCACGHSST